MLILGITAKINYEKNWQNFVDVMLQLFLYRAGEKDQDILLPSFIRTLAISFVELPSENQGETFF